MLRKAENSSKKKATFISSLPLPARSGPDGGGRGGLCLFLRRFSGAFAGLARGCSEPGGCGSGWRRRGVDLGRISANARRGALRWTGAGACVSRIQPFLACVFHERTVLVGLLRLCCCFSSFLLSFPSGLIAGRFYLSFSTGLLEKTVGVLLLLLGFEVGCGNAYNLTDRTRSNARCNLVVVLGKKEDFMEPKL